MYSKLYYINILKFDFITKLNKFSIYDLINLDSIKITLKTENFLNEFDSKFFKSFFLLEWFTGQKPLIKKITFLSNHIKLILIVNLRSFFMFNFLDYLNFFLWKIIQFKYFYYNKNIFLLKFKDIFLIPNIPQRFFNLNSNIFLQFNFSKKVKSYILKFFLLN